ncbi:hypothetical protein ACRRTK_014555 [Alexandromys fortis]
MYNSPLELRADGPSSSRSSQASLPPLALHPDPLNWAQTLLVVGAPHCSASLPRSPRSKADSSSSPSGNPKPPPWPGRRKHSGGRSA